MNARYEMIHETRVVPLDGRPHLAKSVRLYMGDPRGHWDADAITYEATIDDPYTWAKPWKVMVRLSTQPGSQIFPYECHEGNFALKNILSAARAEERAAADARRKGLAPPEPSEWQGHTGFLPADPSFGRPR